MTIVIVFKCGNCGYGPLNVDDNREAPIPSPPITIHDPEGEGETIGVCPRCKDELPEFSRFRATHYSLKAACSHCGRYGLVDDQTMDCAGCGEKHVPAPQQIAARDAEIAYCRSVEMDTP